MPPNPDAGSDGYGANPCARTKIVPVPDVVEQAAVPCTTRASPLPCTSAQLSTVKVALADARPVVVAIATIAMTMIAKAAANLCEKLLREDAAVTIHGKL